MIQLCLVEYTPGDRRQGYEYLCSSCSLIAIFSHTPFLTSVICLHRYIKDMEKGMSVAAVLCTHSSGGSIFYGESLMISVWRLLCQRTRRSLRNLNKTFQLILLGR